MVRRLAAPATRPIPIQANGQEAGAAVLAGASGYVLKDIRGQGLIEGIRAVAERVARSAPPSIAVVGAGRRSSDYAIRAERRLAS